MELTHARRALTPAHHDKAVVPGGWGGLRVAALTPASGHRLIPRVPAPYSLGGGALGRIGPRWPFLGLCNRYTPGAPAPTVVIEGSDQHRQGGRDDDQQGSFAETRRPRDVVPVSRHRGAGDRGPAHHHVGADGARPRAR